MILGCDINIIFNIQIQNIQRILFYLLDFFKYVQDYVQDPNH